MAKKVQLTGDGDIDRRSDEEAGGFDDEEDYDNQEEPDFSDPEDFVDNITDEKLLPDLLASRPKEADGVDSVIVVYGVPNVGADRLEKLKTVIKKIFNKVCKHGLCDH